MKRCPSNDNFDSKEEALLASYLEICNKALEANKDAFPYKQIWQAAQSLLKDKTIALSVYDDRPKATYDVIMHDNHIDVVDIKHEKTTDAWCVNMSYLEKVVSSPEEYINHPAKMDWDWLRNRVKADD